jgi:hypothetical protein
MFYSSTQHIRKDKKVDTFFKRETVPNDRLYGKPSGACETKKFM